MNVSKSLLFLALSGVSSSVIAADAKSIPEPAAFVKKAAQDGMTEVAVGKVALARSQDPSIRSFAQRMVDDHGKANEELSSIAQSKGIEVPKELDSEHRTMVDALSAKSGSEFDREYSQHMNMDHSKAIALFEGAARSSDADLAKFARKTLPTLKQHKQLAETLPAKSDGAAPGGG